MEELGTLTALANDRFERYRQVLGAEAAPHRVEFSPRITTSWALIYYRRRLVRLSPYLFLLDPSDLRRGSHWGELDATLRHEAAHAATFARTGETGHSPLFHRHLRALGVNAHGACDRGPENAAFRYLYQCPTCAYVWRRRTRLSGNWSCGTCGPGRYSHDHRMQLVAELEHPWRRVLSRAGWVRRAIEEAWDNGPVETPPQPSSASTVSRRRGRA